MKEDQKLQAENSLMYVLEKNNMPNPQSRQIHALVVIPAKLQAASIKKQLRYKGMSTESVSQVLECVGAEFRQALTSEPLPSFFTEDEWKDLKDLNWRTNSRIHDGKVPTTSKGKSHIHEEEYAKVYIGNIFAYELEGLKRLNIQAIKWGSSYRDKGRGRTGEIVYVSNVSRRINQRLVAKQYNASTETLEKHLSPDYKADSKYHFYNGNQMESNLHEGIEATDFNDKLENVLSIQVSAFTVNIALGYVFVGKNDPDDTHTRYFYSNLTNTYVCSKSVSINSKADIRKKGDFENSVYGVG
ncbi:CRN-like protein [Plasmopara halstedii]|uniref:CRN-like protein n=1 Tax=Plasmopara halstedii TaxID=4781 RepID=A0A0P1ALX7_PLAHL|nr:CRN-like protein [Plasmopara halstedii]CEG42333.1 CRN-like protein [Plasmopara halstedii]|eukprot:XP_024578702.1 CRN-like protein [Plasmopara halstedii]